MRRLLLVGWLYVSVLTTILTFAVPAIRADGGSALIGSALFAVISVTAMAARVVWGRIADSAAGTRRRATLRDVGVVAAVGALVYWGASSLGSAFALPAMALFAFGALGFNGVLYLIAGELAGPDRAGQAVGFVATALFGGAALVSVPLGMLADSAGYEALWPAGALLAGLGVLVTLGLRPPSDAPAAVRA
jgi:MFS family permease